MANRTATLATATTAIAPTGGGITLPAGTYPVYEADGVRPGVLYLLDPDDTNRIVGCIPATSATVRDAS